MELFGEWGGTWSLLLDLTAIVVLLNHTAGCARKGHGRAQRARCAATRQRSRMSTERAPSSEYSKDQTPLQGGQCDGGMEV